MKDFNLHEMVLRLMYFNLHPALWYIEWCIILSPILIGLEYFKILLLCPSHKRGSIVSVMAKTSDPQFMTEKDVGWITI